MPATSTTTPAFPDEVYTKFTVAGGVFFIVTEILYFAFSGLPSFYVPVPDAFETAVGRDFMNTWMGGRSAFAGGPAAWFDYKVYNEALREILGRWDFPYQYWSYPPHVLLFIWPFGLLPYLPAYVLWCALGLIAFLRTAFAAGVSREQMWFLALAPAAAMNIFIGQNGFFTAALLIGGLACLDRRPILAGVLFGILTVKPQLGLLLPIILVLTGRWRTIASAVVTTAILIGATAWLYGPEIWSGYIDKVVPQQAWLQQNGAGLLLVMIPSAFFAGRLLGLPLDIAWTIQWAVSAAAVAAVIWTYWRRRDPQLSAALLLTATFLVTPYSLNYDMVVLIWVVALLRQRPDSTPFDHRLGLAIWALPVAMMLAGVVHIPLAMLLLPAFAARLLWRLAQAERRSPVARDGAVIAAGGR